MLHNGAPHVVKMLVKIFFLAPHLLCSLAMSNMSSMSNMSNMSIMPSMSNMSL